MINKTATGFSSKIKKIKTYEMVCYTNDLLEGPMDNWPSHIQDQIHEAVERLAQREQHPTTIVYARADIDYGDAQDGSKDRPFVKVIASEIIAGDQRFMEPDKEDEIAKAVQRMMQGGGSIQ